MLVPHRYPKVEIRRRRISKRIVARRVTGRQLAAHFNRMPNTGAPWHEDGLTDFQRECEDMMLQRDRFSGDPRVKGFGRNRKRRGMPTLPATHEDVLEQRDHETTETKSRTHESEGWAGLSYHDAIAVDFMATGSFDILKAGTNGVPVGRQKHGLAGDFLKARLNKDLPYELSDLQTCVGMHKRVGRSAVMYDHFALFVFARSPNRQSLAELLGCARKTIDRAHAKGAILTEQLNRIEGKLDALLERFQTIEPTAEEIAQAVEDFIDGALSNAA